MSPTRHTTLGVDALLRQLGVKGQELPRIEVDRYQPVLVMGDFSRTLTAEPLEARGVAAQSVGAVAGRIGTVQLLSNAPGGVVIESLILSAPGWVNLDAHFRAGVYTSALFSGSAASVLDVGGAATRSSVTYGTHTASVAAGFASFGPDRTTVSGGAAIDLGALRWYVPTGRYFIAQAGSSQVWFDFEISWREIPTPIGSP